jgi:hypothetical protein
MSDKWVSTLRTVSTVQNPITWSHRESISRRLISPTFGNHRRPSIGSAASGHPCPSAAKNSLVPCWWQTQCFSSSSTFSSLSRLPYPANPWRSSSDSLRSDCGTGTGGGGGDYWKMAGYIPGVRFWPVHRILCHGDRKSMVFYVMYCTKNGPPGGREDVHQWKWSKARRAVCYLTVCFSSFLKRFVRCVVECRCMGHRSQRGRSTTGAGF